MHHDDLYIDRYIYTYTYVYIYIHMHIYVYYLLSLPVLSNVGMTSVSDLVTARNWGHWWIQSATGTFTFCKVKEPATKKKFPSINSFLSIRPRFPNFVSMWVPLSLLDNQWPDSLADLSKCHNRCFVDRTRYIGPILPYFDITYRWRTQLSQNRFWWLGLDDSITVTSDMEEIPPLKCRLISFCLVFKFYYWGNPINRERISWVLSFKRWSLS